MSRQRDEPGRDVCVSARCQINAPMASYRLRTAGQFASSAPVRRWRALDRLRALAVVSMIQGHLFAALLRPGELSGALGRWHATLHGLTAPAFFFGAGLAFGTATYVRYESHRTLGGPLHRRLGRYLMLALLGYALQLPGGSLWAAFRAQGEQLALVCRVGPLQLVAAVLCLAQLTILIAPTPRRHALLSAGLGAVAMLTATAVVQSDAAGRLGPFLGAFLDDRGGAHFPLLPWSTFVLFGIGCAGMRHHCESMFRARPLLVAGALLATASYVFYDATTIEHDASWWWRTSPSYLLFRAGLVVFLLGALHSRGDRCVAPKPQEGWSAVLARHALVAYVAHLLLLYGTWVTPNVALLLGRSLNLATAGVACGLLLAATAGIVHVWDWSERQQLLTFRRKSAALALGAIAIMFLVR